MKYKTSDLSVAVLDAAVAKAEGVEVAQCRGGYLAYAESARIHTYSAKQYSPSTDWEQGGPLIERERIALVCFRPERGTNDGERWDAYFNGDYHNQDGAVLDEKYQYGRSGTTPLIAAMRALVATKLGDEVDL